MAGGAKMGFLVLVFSSHGGFCVFFFFFWGGGCV